jgi:TRAP-type C4-dicarboxylate transport system permease small subunit
VIDKLIDALCRAFSWLMVACMALMVCMVFGNVVLRYGFNAGITVSEELSRWLFVWMTFLGAVVGLHRRAHLGTDMLLAALKPAGQKVCFILAHLLMLFISVLMVQGAWAQTVINLGTTSAAMEVPVAWLYASGVVFAVLATVVLLNNLWRLITGRLHPSELIGVRESEDQPAAQERP